jgi:nucleoside-diphosphate-sugar epimerase
MNSGKVSILGCGWLGVPLAKHLQEKRFSVRGSATSPEKCEILAKAGILSNQVLLSETEAFADDFQFFNCDVLIISIPPRRIAGIERIFPAQIAQLIPLILKHNIRKVIFISSTSVYPEMCQTAREDDELPPDKESGKALLLAESLLNGEKDFKTTHLRFGGLIGADRNPARFLMKSERPVANIPVNLIHQDDCIGIIAAIIDQDLWGETLNACCPEHPFKKDFYGKAAVLSGLPEPLISDQKESYKIVDSSKLIRLLNYRFKFKSPMDYLDSVK